MYGRIVQGIIKIPFSRQDQSCNYKWGVGELSNDGEPSGPICLGSWGDEKLRQEKGADKFCEIQVLLLIPLLLKEVYLPPQVNSKFHKMMCCAEST